MTEDIDDYEEFFTELLAKEIWEKFEERRQDFPNDSTVPKYYLPETLTYKCLREVAGLTALLYRKEVESQKPRPSELINCEVSTLLARTALLGMNSYLIERSHNTEGAPFSVKKRILTNSIIDDVKKYFKNEIFLSPAIIEVFNYANFLLENKYEVEKTLFLGKTVSWKVFEASAMLAFLYGYFIAKNGIREE